MGGSATPILCYSASRWGPASVDKQSMGAGLAVLAMAMMLIGVFTNSWWKVKRGWSWQGVGLLKQKMCVDPPGMMERCEAIKHEFVRKAMIEASKNWSQARVKIQKMLESPRFKNAPNRAELEASIQRLDDMLSNTDNIDITVGDGSWITMGKFVYYGTFLVLILLAIALSMSRIGQEHAAMLDKIAAAGCFALLTVAFTFVFRAPDYIKESIPAFNAGYSRYIYWLGAAAGTAAGVMLSMSMAEMDDPITNRLFDRDKAGDAAPRRPLSKPPAAADGGPRCPQCGARPEFREDVGCFICPSCRINV